MAINTLKPFFSVSPTIALAMLFLFVLAIIIFYLLNKLQTISNLENKIKQFSRTIKDLDQQAKLIIKGDMELKLYQQEVEDKINKLTLIKNLILTSIHILDKDKLFLQITEKVLNDLGFKNGLILGFDDLEPKSVMGVNDKDIAKIKALFKYKKETLRGIQKLPTNSEIYKKLVIELGTKEILVVPIKARGRIYAIFMAINLILHTGIKESEEEALLIICMYLGQCLNNINLFEDIYHAKDDLEKKIKERTNELVKSLREIEVISKTKSDFISSVSHELRTPLTSVKGFSALLVDEKFGKLPENAKKRLLKIDENVNKLMGIVNTLLDISRIESGKTEVKIAPADITKLIKDVGDLLTPQMATKNITFSTELPEETMVLIDKNFIERVLINLINNSIKFTPENGKITVRCTKKERVVIVVVSDSGVGIPKDDLPKIFQEFYRTSTTAGMPGTGLGLSLVKRIIDTHKEKIWVDSTLGKGTNFHFTLKLE